MAHPACSYAVNGASPSHHRPCSRAFGGSSLPLPRQPSMQACICSSVLPDLGPANPRLRSYRAGGGQGLLKSRGHDGPTLAWLRHINGFCGHKLFTTIVSVESMYLFFFSVLSKLHHLPFVVDSQRVRRHFQFHFAQAIFASDACCSRVRQILPYFLNAPIRLLVELSWPSPLPGSSSSLRIFLASTLPSSTPHWSKLLMSQIAPSVNVRCS